MEPEVMKFYWTFETFDVDGNVDGYCLESKEGDSIDFIRTLKRFDTEKARNLHISSELVGFSDETLHIEAKKRNLRPLKSIFSTK